MLSQPGIAQWQGQPEKRAYDGPSQWKGPPFQASEPWETGSISPDQNLTRVRVLIGEAVQNAMLQERLWWTFCTASPMKTINMPLSSTKCHVMHSTKCHVNSVNRRSSTKCHVNRRKQTKTKTRPQDKMKRYRRKTMTKTPRTQDQERRSRRWKSNLNKSSVEILVLAQWKQRAVAVRMDTVRVRLKVRVKVRVRLGPVLGLKNSFFKNQKTR